MYGMNMNPYNAYNPNAFNQFTMNQAQCLTRVTGIDGAKAYQMGANSTVALFDNNDDLMYVKTTDGAGFPTIRTFRFEEITDFSKNEKPVNSENYITREEMEEYVKQFIQSQPKSRAKANADTTTDAIRE